MKDFITVAIFTYPSEYAVLAHLLEQEDIQFVFENETMISVLPFHSNAIGGIRLKVHPNDKELVLKIIKGLDKNSQMRIV